MEGLGFVIVLVIVVIFLMTSVKIIPEYERAVIFRLGRVLGKEKGPGVFFLIPLVDRMARVSIRTITMDVEPQDVISRDNVSLKVSAVLFFRVVSPVKAVCAVENYLYATSQLAQTHLRSILGEHKLDELLTEREKINTQISRILDENTGPWGVKVESMEVKHIDLPPDMQRAMAREAESERERRAKVIAAAGEFEAATKLQEAAELMEKSPITIQLRYLQTLSDISSEPSMKIVFPIPIDLLTALKKFASP